MAGWAGALLLAIPLLFAAVWVRTEVSEELRVRDGLYAARDSLEQSLLQLDSRRTRLTGWNHVEQTLAGSGLRLPERPDVLWIDVRLPGGRGG